MKKLFLLSVMLLATSGFLFAQEAPKNNQPAPNQPVQEKAVFKWGETTHEFGKIPQGKPVTYEFKFTNTGKAPLVLTNVRGSCGCTTTDYTKEPVAPGKTGYIKATFNAAAMGNFTKSITVTANTENGSEVLYIKGEVITTGDQPQGSN